MSRVSDCTPTLVILSTRLSPFWRILTFYSQPVCHWARVQDMRRLMMHAGGGWGSTRVMGTVGTVRTSVYPYDHPPGTHYPGQYTSGTLIPGSVHQWYPNTRVNDCQTLNTRVNDCQTLNTRVCGCQTPNTRVCGCQTPNTRVW